MPRDMLHEPSGDYSSGFFTHLYFTEMDIDQLQQLLTEHRWSLGAYELYYQHLAAQLADFKSKNDEFDEFDQTDSLLDHVCRRFDQALRPTMPSKLRLQVADFQVIQRKLGQMIRWEEGLLKASQEQFKRNRFWGTGVTLTDLPHELLLEIVQQLGFVHQQRLMRVCKLWLRTIAHEVDHIYLDAASLYQSHINNFGLLILTGSRCESPITEHDRFRAELQESDQRVRIHPSCRRRLPWKYDQRSARQLTFNGQHVALFTSTSQYMVQMAGNYFPELSQINFGHVILDGEDHFDPFYTLNLRSYLQLRQSSGIAVTLLGCIIPAFPSNGSLPYHSGLKQLHGEAAKTMGPNQDHYYVRMADVLWTSEEDFREFYEGILPMMGIAWPYPNEQLEWLAHWAPCLNGDKVVVKLIGRFMERYPYWRQHNLRPIMCEDHREFCDHLTAAFFRDMDGQMRNLVAYYLLQLKAPEMVRPPAPFAFEKFHHCQGRSARFGLADFSS